MSLSEKNMRPVILNSYKYNKKRPIGKNSAAEAQAMGEIATKKREMRVRDFRPELFEKLPTNSNIKLSQQEKDERYNNAKIMLQKQNLSEIQKKIFERQLKTFAPVKKVYKKR